MLTLLLAAIGNRNKGACSGYSISLGEGTGVFIDKKDVEQMITKLAGKIKGKEIADFNLFELEQELENNSWINDAELWFDNQDMLHIKVSEKQPVGMVFTTNGQSFYIDHTGRKIPLSAKRTARVPVFTGFPDSKKYSGKDSALQALVTSAANFIYNDPFWMAQVAQVDIDEKGKFEMIPVVGNHIVRLGSGEEIAKKFNRLYIFYKQVLSKKGFNSYQAIDVQYKGQVVASKNTENVKVDAARYRKHIEKLISESQDDIEPIPGKYELATDSVTAPAPELVEIERIESVKTPDIKTTGPNPLKSLSSTPENVQKEKSAPKPKKRVPKAVMPKKETTGEEANGGYN